MVLNEYVIWILVFEVNVRKKIIVIVNEYYYLVNWKKLFLGIRLYEFVLIFVYIVFFFGFFVVLNVLI